MEVKATSTPLQGASSYRWVILLLATLVQAGVSLLQQTPSVLGPVLTRDLGLTRAQVGLLSSAIWGGMLFTMLPAGILIDRRGERNIILAGTTAMALFVLLASQASGFAWLFALLLLASLGASGTAPGGSKAIASWFPRSRRGGAMGIRQTGMPVGGLTAALILPTVAVRFGWRAGLGAAAAVALLTVIAFALFYREMPTERSASLRPPLRTILQNRNLLAATGYAFVLVGVQGCVTSYLALYLHEAMDISVVRAGAYVAVLQVGGIAGRIGWGVVSDRIGRRAPVMLLVGMIAVAASLAMAFAGRGLPVLSIPILAFLLGSSAMGWNALYLTLVSEAVGTHAAATAMGASLTVSFIGAFVTPPLFGLAADWTGSYQLSWMGLAVWAAAGTALGLLVRESGGRAWRNDQR